MGEHTLESIDSSRGRAAAEAAQRIVEQLSLALPLFLCCRRAALPRLSRFAFVFAPPHSVSFVFCLLALSVCLHTLLIHVSASVIVAAAH